MVCYCICSCGKCEVEQFFDTREDLSSASDSCPDSPLSRNQFRHEDVSNSSSYHQQFNFWVKRPDSVKERRSQFRRWMGATSPSGVQLESTYRNSDALIDVDLGAADIDRMASENGCVLRGSDTGNCHSMCRPSTESDATRNLDVDNVTADNEFQQNGSLAISLSVDSSKSMTARRSKGRPKLSSLVHHCIYREDNSSIALTSSSCINKSRRRTDWLKRLGIAACIVGGQEMSVTRKSSSDGYLTEERNHRVKVRTYRKRSKEFSAVYMGQDIKAHEGAIRTMKFSPDGQYLASGGEDGIVRVWHVKKRGWTAEGGFPEEDPSCIYFMADHKSRLNPIFTLKEKKEKSSSKRKSSDSACVVIPPNVFRISDRPLHEFRGHDADVLDISWSENKYLLSSSADKTVRLWHIGCDQCIKVFPHNDYVTCTQFNPIDERYFVSGSIDGKVRIWDTFGCHVVDWIDVKGIVSAVCYQPNGNEIVVGCLTGICRFYSVSDSRLQLDNQIAIPGKKKFPSKRITGFQFSPVDPRKLMVTLADSQIVILDRLDIVSKYKGFRNGRSQISASFTSDGRHIVSASEDSNVYIWNHIDCNSPMKSQVKSTWSSERFVSNNVSVAIPWTGNRKSVPVTSDNFTSQQEVIRILIGSQESWFRSKSDLSNNPRSQPPNVLKLTSVFFSEFPSKASATWPEEKLLPSLVTSPPSLCRSHYRFLKNHCRNLGTSPHAWGRVIVTAGWDGRIRSFCNYGLPVEI